MARRAKPEPAPSRRRDDREDCEPCDCCSTGICFVWSFDGRRRCLNCIAELEAEWLRRRALAEGMPGPTPASLSPDASTPVDEIPPGAQPAGPELEVASTDVEGEDQRELWN